MNPQDLFKAEWYAQQAFLALLDAGCKNYPLLHSLALTCKELQDQGNEAMKNLVS